MNVESILEFNKTGGFKYKELTAKQKQHLEEKFFCRKPVGSEKTDLYRYHFNKDGVCTHAT